MSSDRSIFVPKLTSLISTVLTHPESAMEAFAGWSRDHGREPDAAVNRDGGPAA